MYPIQRQEEIQNEAAEWCEHDDIVLHWEGENGEKSTIRSKFTGLTMPDTFKDWTDHKAGNVKLTGATDRPHVIVIGPPCKWYVVHIEGNHGYVLDQDTTVEYAPNQSVIFTLTKME